MFPGCYKIPIGISASGPNSRCHQQNKIRLNDVSLNCVIICHALIQYTHLFLKCLRCTIFIGATHHIWIPHEPPSLLYDHTNVILMVVVGVLLYYHKITEYGIKCCMHAHLEAPRAPPSRGELYRCKTLFLDNFPIFFLSKWDLDPPTHFQIISGFF